MTYFSLLPDDLSPPEIAAEDRMLCRQLEEAIRKYFYEACDGVTQALLLNCEWRVVSNAEALMLLISTEEVSLYERVLNNLAPLGAALRHFIDSARIRIFPPDTIGTPFDVRVDELSV